MHITKRNDIPAMAILVLDGDRIIDLAVAGVRVRGGEEQVTLEDAWHLGSCTKAMTATLAARLVDQGTLRWDSTIAEVLPDMTDGMDPVYRDVTLKDLLLHRGGAGGQASGDRVRGNVSRVTKARSVSSEVFSLKMSFAWMRQVPPGSSPIPTRGTPLPGTCVPLLQAYPSKIS